MGFVGWFEVLPRLRTFRPLFCCGPKLSVEEGLKACAWRLTVFTFLRILLLATWGIATIPSWQNEHVRRRLPGLWLEFVVLTALVTIAVTMILVTWQLSVRYLYGCIVALPLLFLFDFSVKATCYEVLFMSPTASVFGVVSLIEFWIRYAALTQTWLLLVTYIKEISPDETGMYMAGGSNSRNSQIVRRNNSSIWEKPRLHPKRVTSSVPPNLPHISERSESYKSHIEYDRSPRQSQRQSQSQSRRSGNFSGRSPRNSRSTANRHSHRHSNHSGQFESEHESLHHDRDMHHNPDHHDHRDSHRHSQRTDRRSIHHDDPYGFDDPESHRDSLQQENAFQDVSYNSSVNHSKRQSYRMRPESSHIEEPSHMDHLHPSQMDENMSHLEDEVEQPYDQPYDEQVYDDLVDEEEIQEESPPPPPRTRPKWREPEILPPPIHNSPPDHTHDHLIVNNRNIASRQTSQTSSITALKRNWEGGTGWRNPKQLIGRINSDNSEMSQYSSNRIYRNESPLI